MYLCCVTQVSVNAVGVYVGTSKDNVLCFLACSVYSVRVCVSACVFVSAGVEWMLSLATVWTNKKGTATNTAEEKSPRY